MKMTLTAAIAAAGINTAVMVNDANAEPSMALNNNVMRLARNDAEDNGAGRKSGVKKSIEDVPMLNFRKAKLGGKVVEITPDLVKKFAAKGQIKIPMAKEDNVMNLATFTSLLERIKKSKTSSVIIGVVVKDEPYSPPKPDYDGRDHFRAVKKRVIEIMTGRKADGSKKTKGYAELFGGEVMAIIPVKYSEGDTYGNAEDEFPFQVNDIILAVNDNGYAIQPENYNLINTVDDLELHLQDYFERDKHLYGNKELVANRDVIYDAARKKYGRTNPYFMFTEKYEKVLRENEAGGY